MGCSPLRHVLGVSYKGTQTGEAKLWWDTFVIYTFPEFVLLCIEQVEELAFPGSRGITTAAVADLQDKGYVIAH